jgi:hypothetical protein
VRVAETSHPHVRTGWSRGGDRRIPHP